MRAIPIFTALLFLPACTGLPGLDDPKFKISPRVYVDVHKGEARMQSVQDGAVVDNPPQGTKEFGQNGHDEDWSMVVMAGDGFSGLEAEYRHIAIEDTSTGVLSADFGSVPGGTIVSSKLAVEAWRLAYFGELLGHRFEIGNNQELDLKLAGALALAHRDGTFRVAEDGNTGVQQTIHFSDTVTPYVGVRGRAGWRGLSLDVDLLFDPDIHFGGDFAGAQKDIAVTARYHIEAQDVTLLAGYRWLDLNTSGGELGLRYDTDFQVEGFVLGLEVDF